jgi:hypothetical protein
MNRDECGNLDLLAATHFFKESLQGAIVKPTAIELGGITFIVAMFAFARQLGGWEHRVLAKCLAIVAAGLFVAWCFLFFPIWIGCASAAIVWSICLWFIFGWVRNRTSSGPTDAGVPISDLDTETQRLAELEYDQLTLPEKISLKCNLQNRRVTEEQIRQRFDELGIIGPDGEMFNRLNKKTRFMDSDFKGPNGIRAEYQQLVSQLLEKSPL